MNYQITVEAKTLGQRRALPDWIIPLPPPRAGRPMRLRDLITTIVRAEVAQFQARQAERQLVRWLTASEIEAAAGRGKVDLGDRDDVQAVAPDEAVGAALLAFEDGLYLVFVDGAQQHDLDAEVMARPDSRLTFVRLTLLAGG